MEQDILQQILVELKELKAGQQALENGQKALEAGQKSLESGQRALEAGQQALEIGQQSLKDDLENVKEDVRHTRMLVEHQDHKISLIAEQHSDIIAKLKKVDEVDGLKDRVMNLERVTMVHTDEIQKLKIAQ